MNTLFEKGKEGFLTGAIAFVTDTIKAMLSDGVTADVGIKAITAATNATPIVVTASSHGFANGDLVWIDGVGGNLSANGVWRVANQAANTFELTNPITGANVVGSGAYTSGGVAINLGPTGDFIDDFSASRVGTDQTLGSKTVTGGVVDAADPTWTALTGAVVKAILLYKDTGSEGTSRPIGIITGKQIVTCAVQANSSGTSITVDPLAGAIPSGTVLTFSNGASATLSAPAAAGARSISVSALAANIAAEARAQSVITGSGLPFTPNGGDVTLQFDNGAYKIFSI